MRRLLALAVAAAVLSGCSPKAADWNRYPGLRETVLLLAEEKDCQGLTDTANLLRLDNEQARARWGSDNGPLVREVERKAEVAGCRRGG